MKSSLANFTSRKQHISSNNTMSTFHNNTAAINPFHHNITHKRRAKTPSFSSILLDAIYRSIDDNYTDTDSSSSHNPHTPKTVSTTTSATNIARDSIPASKQRRTKMRSDSHLDTIELRHAIIIDSWIDKQQPSPPPPPQHPYYSHHNYNYKNNNYNYNNADISNIRFVRQKSVPSKSATLTSSSTSSSSSCFTQPKICKNISTKRETSPRIFNKTKLRALKIYNDLKKSKQQQNQQPISPGARIAAFLNSIFRNSGGTPARNSPEINTSACSSASSLSRSCLIKTTASTQKSNRSVRFYPVNVILDNEDSTLYDHIIDDKKVIVPVKGVSDEKEQRKWNREKEIDALIMKNKRNRNSRDYKEVVKMEIDSDEGLMNIDDDDEDEDDGESCASSDLFELENFSTIGASRFSQELPVYGTTSLNNLTS